MIIFILKAFKTYRFSVVLCLADSEEINETLVNFNFAFEHALYCTLQRSYIVAHPLPPFIPTVAQGQHWKDILTDECEDISEKEIVIWGILYSFTLDRNTLDDI